MTEHEIVRHRDETERMDGMKFTKMQGCGNDYVYVDCTKAANRKEPLPNAGEIAKKVSDRHFGVGSDGLILICASEMADFRMDMYNADGSRGEMCGNGIRCVGKFVYDKGLTDRKKFTVETLAGIKTLEVKTEGNEAVSVLVDMGSPVLACEKIPVKLPENMCGEDAGKGGADGKNADEMQAICVPIEVGDETYEMTCVSMGNPHCVIFMEEDVRSLDLEKIGPMFECHPYFPKRVNTEFVNVLDAAHLRMRVWERGSGETLACGTGACAIVAAACLNHLTKESADVELLGGHLQITYDQTRNLVWMEGPAVTVFEGEIDLT